MKIIRRDPGPDDLGEFFRKHLPPQKFKLVQRVAGGFRWKVQLAEGAPKSRWGRFWWRPADVAFIGETGVVLRRPELFAEFERIARRYEFESHREVTLEY